MKVREAQKQDKKHIVDFCKNTFSWGDYVSEVWDSWELEGNLMVVEENQKPVALCHASINNSARQIWIEGIRVHPDYRRRGFAYNLVSKLESIGINQDLLNSFMLIEVNNFNSISLAKKLNYKKIDTWWFYSLLPKSIKDIDSKQFLSQTIDLNDELFDNKMFVKSWRWLPLDKLSLQNFIKQKRILVTKTDSSFSLMILTDSDHFTGTLIVTVYGNSKELLYGHLQFIQNFASQQNYSRIQIITTLNDLKYDKELQQRISFYLMKKEL